LAAAALTQLFSLSSPLSVDPIPSPPPDVPSAAGLQADLVAIQVRSGKGIASRRVEIRLADDARSPPQNVYESILRAMNEARENRKFARPLGGLLVGCVPLLIYPRWTLTVSLAGSLGFLILVNGVSRYFSVQKYLVVNKFPSTRLPVLMVSVITGAAIVIVLGVVLGM
jgi:hypothetical protein